MLDAFTTDQQNLLSPSNGTLAPSVEPTAGEAFSAAWEANSRLDGYDAAFSNQRDFAQQRFDAFTAKTGVAIPPPTTTADPRGAPAVDTSFQDWLNGGRALMQAESAKRNDPSLLPPSDQDIAAGGLELARGAVRRQAAVSAGPITLGSIAGRTAAGAASSALDPLNAVSLALAPEGGPVLATALRMGGVMGGQQLVGDLARLGYRQQVDPTYGVGDVAKDVAGAAVGGALFGAGQAVGGSGIRGTLGAAAGGAVGGAALGAMGGGGVIGALEGALGGAALPLAGAGFGMGAKSLGMSWRALKAVRPEIADAMPLDVRDAGQVSEKAGDVQAQNPWPGAAGDAAHAEAVDAAEKAIVAGQPFDLPPAAQAEAEARRGTVFYPGGSIDARYDVAEHADLVTSHDADYNVRPDYPPELQPRDRSGAPAQAQVASIAADLQPDRLGISPEANSGAPIVGLDGVVESGNGRVLAIGRAYDQGRADGYRAWLERQGFDTTGMDRPVLVGMRETPMDTGQRADFAHAANGSASLRMSATETALSDARHIDGPTLDLVKSQDLTAASNRDLARAFVAKLPEGERGGLLKLDGGMSANGAQRLRAALTARAYGDPAFISRAFDHLDSNIKAIGGAMADAAPAWARMRDAATRGDIAPGHDITGDTMQAVHTIMRARDEGRPVWEQFNQHDFFKSDTSQLAARMFFRDEEMRQPAGRKAIAEALTSYAEESAKNTLHGRLFDDAVAPTDVLRRMGAIAAERIGGLFDQASQDVLAMVRPDEDDVAGRGRAAPGMVEPAVDTPSTGIMVRNYRTGETVQAQSVGSLKDMLGRFSAARDASADPIARASALAIGSKLAKLVGDTSVYVVGPTEMRTLVEGRMKVQPGYEPAGFFDPREGQIVLLDDALRNPAEAGPLVLHEGAHAFAMRAIDESPAARSLIDTIRQAAIEAHEAAGGRPIRPLRADQRPRVYLRGLLELDLPALPRVDPRERRDHQGVRSRGPRAFAVGRTRRRHAQDPRHGARRAFAARCDDAARQAHRGSSRGSASRRRRTHRGPTEGDCR